MLSKPTCKVEIAPSSLERQAGKMICIAGSVMNEQRINQVVEKRVDAAFLDNLARTKKLGGVTAQDIQNELGLYRSNASAALNALVKKGSLVKIESRPVYFLPARMVAEHWGIEEIQQVYTPGEFLALFAPKQPAEGNDSFGKIIGGDSSLTEQIVQAKAAMGYPPHGLHTLIIGESGTGKTLFSRAMYTYALTALGRDEKKYPYVAFNCADYFHNPQLLMSHLFGYVKGAFTGAVEETNGVVERANGGILFLDEIHRLPPEGQELLFYLMDTGHYRKLGESAAMRAANVLIIGATTEDPQNVLLKTFARRIPVTIRLPAFREKTTHEKLRIIEFFFANEAAAIQKNFRIKQPVVKALASYDYPGNMGQLHSEIKVVCARTYLDNSSEDDEFVICQRHLSPLINQHHARLTSHQSHFPVIYDFDITIAPACDIQYDVAQLFDEKSYQILWGKIDQCTAEGYSKKELDAALAENVRDYYNSVLQNFSHRQINRQEMYKAVAPEIVAFTIGVMHEVAEELGVIASQKNILVMAFHIKHLLERIEEKEEPVPKEVNLEEVHRAYVRELTAAQQIVERISTTYGATVPSNEKYLIAILLANLHADDRKTEIRPRLYILAHGNSTATSMADVCNRLLSCDYVVGIDVPLEQGENETHQHLVSTLQSQNQESGAILLADMGELLSLGDRIAAELGMKIVTLPNVTTLIALEITRMLCKGESVETIYVEYISKMRPTLRNAPRKSAIITVCASGVGTSQAFKNMLKKELGRTELDHINVVSMNYLDAKNRTAQYQRIAGEYELLACIGNMDCQLDIPFYHVSDLLAEEDWARFIKFIQGIAVRPTESASGPSQESDFEAECRYFLEKNVVYLNPVMAVWHGIRFLDALQLARLQNDRSLRLSLLLHLGFMLERVIAGKWVAFDGQEEFIRNNRGLYDRIHSSVHILEEAFSLSINDAELCYIIQAINNAEACCD